MSWNLEWKITLRLCLGNRTECCCYSYCYVTNLISSNLLRCRHFAISSDLLFSCVSGLARKIASFSDKQRLHCFIPHSYAAALHAIRLFYGWTMTNILKVLNQLWELCLVPLGWVFEAVNNTFVITYFKIRFTAAIICHYLAIWCIDWCFINDGFLRKKPSRTQFAFLRQLRGGGCSSFFWCWLVEYTLIMISNDYLILAKKL